MRCKTCDYSLWNLKTRQCPECGSPFRPSEFEFVDNSVCFCCPECEQSYYGRGENGHLVPVEFDCVKCGAHLHMDDMILRPAAGLEDEHTRPDRMPWLERRERGFFKGWVATIGHALVQPGPLLRGVVPGSSTKPAWGFAILTQASILLLSMIPSMLIVAILPMFIARAGRGGAPGLGTLLGVIAGMSGIGLIGGVLFLVGYMLVWGAFVHAVLRMTGTLTHGIGTTYQAICYSSGANVVTAVPCLGPYVGWIWWLVSAVMAVQNAHRIKGFRASVAVLALPLSLFIIIGGAYFAMITVAMMGASGSGPGSALMSPQGETASLTGQIVQYATEQGGRGPDHLVELITAEITGTGAFISAGGSTSRTLVPVAKITLDEFRQQGPGLQKQTAAEAVAALPETVVAHRVGDFVYTGHGIDFAADSGGLWIVVLSVDPDLNATTPPGPVHCGRLDGSVQKVGAGAFAAALTAQNALRARHDLPPLPDPATITHDRPAVWDP